MMRRAKSLNGRGKREEDAADVYARDNAGSKSGNGKDLVSVPCFRSQTFYDDSELTRRFHTKGGKLIGEGTYGKVYLAYSREDGNAVALKRIDLKDNDEGVPSTCIREICLLKQLDHPNIVKLIDIVLHRHTSIYMVFEYIDQDLKMFLDRINPRPLPFSYTKWFVFQLLKALSYCHIHRVIHRDLKPQNILVTNTGTVKLADFGLARTYSLPARCYTHEVVTLWYRAPEVLLGSFFYSSGVDIWSLACIFIECVSGEALFRGDSEIDQLYQIFKVLGTPTQRNWPGVERLPEFKNSFPYWHRTDLHKKVPGLDDDGVDLLDAMFVYPPMERITAKMAMAHRYFCVMDMALPPVSSLFPLPTAASMNNGNDGCHEHHLQMAGSPPKKRARTVLFGD